MRMTRAGVIAIVLLLCGCTVAESSDDLVLPQSVVGPLVDDIATTSSTTLPAMRLANGLLPPTNRWFSGLVFGDTPQPVFPLPLSFALVDDGFAFGLPVVASAPGAISAPAAFHLTVTTVTPEPTVTAYDEIAVTVALGQSGTVTLARGSPTVSFVASEETTLGLSAGFESEGDGVYLATADGTAFGLVTDGALSENSVDGTRLELQRGGFANWFPIPVGVDATELAVFARAPLGRVSTSYSSDSDRATTALRYSAAPTLFGTLPHQRAGLISPTPCDLGAFDTVYGEMQLCGGTELVWTVPTLQPRDALDLAGLGAADREELALELGRDIATTDATPGDTYFGGKALARLATLLQIARSLGAADAIETLERRLGTELREWAQPDGCGQRGERCFAYDESVRGIVGQTASFGSDEFNDHHFHYGYFLFAAGVAAQEDPRLAADLAPVMTLLAADLASDGPSTDFPTRRMFDPYSGHSWASGFAPFRDGNNQESSSEAVAAWNGLAAWAAASDDPGLAAEARWLLSSEANSARAYWLDFDENAQPYADYDRSVVGIVWDGKRDYATWFSAEPSAILGIQLLPMQPIADYLAGDPARIRRAVAEASPPGQFADYLLMYQALAGEADAASALDVARALPAAEIDDGNSRTYLLAWILRLR